MAIELRYDADPSRTAFRVVPDRDDPVIMQIEGQLVRVLDISAGGFSCQGIPLVQGMRYRISLDLPHLQSGQFTTYADVVVTDSEDTYRCRFSSLDERQANLLHRYVLRRQKRAIKRLQQTLD